MGGCMKSQEAQLYQPDTETQRNLFRDYAPFGRLDSTVNVNHKYTYLYTVDTSQTLGEGIRQTFSYNCLCNEPELKKERQIFWETRNHGSSVVWGAFRQAVQALTNVDAIRILVAAEVKLITKRITLAIDKKGIRYQIPIFIVNNPPKFGQTTLAERNLSIVFNRDNLKVIVRSTKAQDKKFDVETTCPVENLKEMWLAATKLNGRVRLFTNGRELLDGYCLGNFAVGDGSVLNAMLTPSIQ